MTCSLSLLPLQFIAFMQRGGLGQIRGSKQKQPEEAEDDDTPSQNPFASLFGGTKKIKVCFSLLIGIIHRQIAVKSDSDMMSNMLCSNLPISACQGAKSCCSASQSLLKAAIVQVSGKFCMLGLSRRRTSALWLASG